LDEHLGHAAALELRRDAQAARPAGPEGAGAIPRIDNVADVAELEATGDGGGHGRLAVPEPHEVPPELRFGPRGAREPPRGHVEGRRRGARSLAFRSGRP